MDHFSERLPPSVLLGSKYQICKVWLLTYARPVAVFAAPKQTVFDILGNKRYTTTPASLLDRAHAWNSWDSHMNMWSHMDGYFSL